MNLSQLRRVVPRSSAVTLWSGVSREPGSSLSRECFWSDELKTIIPHLQFCFSSLSKTTKTFGETFYSTFLGKTERLLQVAGVPSWFHFLGQLTACQRDAMDVGQDPVQAATQRLACGSTPSFCVLLRLRKCWQVNPTVLEPRTERGRLHPSHPWLKQNIWNHPAPAYVELPCVYALVLVLGGVT